MINSKSDLKEYLQADMKANRFSENALKRWLNVNYRLLYCLRNLEYHLNNGHRIKSAFWKYLLYNVSVKTGITIGPNVFGKGLYIPHYGYIVVNGSARFGDNCVVQCGVNVSEGVVGGNNLYLGSGAKLMIGVHIADDVIIGANAVVTKDICLPNTVWGGVPAVLISHNGRASGRKGI